MQEIRPASGPRRTPKTIAGKVRPAANPERQQALAKYEAALQLMQEGKFDKARAIFEALAQSAPAEFEDRVRTYLAACVRNAKRAPLNFNTLEEQYDYAISLLNTGDYEDARDQLEAILKKQERADYAHYGLAILDSITGQAEECLSHLARAIDLNGRNRIQARTDNDFQDMTDDPRFTELLYPEG